MKTTRGPLVRKILFAARCGKLSSDRTGGSAASDRNGPATHNASKPVLGSSLNRVFFPVSFFSGSLSAFYCFLFLFFSFLFLFHFFRFSFFVSCFTFFFKLIFLFQNMFVALQNVYDFLFYFLFFSSLP